PDGRTAWVSNYHMYGEGFSAEPKDTCSSGDGATNSFLYKVDTSSLEIVKVVEVGVVPKYVAVTPDGKRVLVTNWCSMDINVIDTATDTVVATVPSGGRYPRGIAIAKDSRTAYVALMGSSKVIALDLTTMTVRDFATPGSRTRHLTMSPDGTKVYATNSGDNNVVELDAATGAILRKVTVGAEPRSMTVSADGGALYVVNYDAATMSKIRISDFTVVATLPTDGNPIGITYEPTKKAVWVACYGGTILVFDDSRKAA
ncbi:MAG TPA: YncE family protein, partial [Phycicoccus sp.]|nr:YncE family protein [Phycicoccus sp.]